MIGKLIRIPDTAADRDPCAAETLKVAVVGACPGAGASFVSARVLQKGLYSGRTPEGMRTLCELGKPYFHTALGFDRRFAGRILYGFSSHGKHELNMEMGYNWYVRKPGEEKLCDRDILKCFYSAQGSLAVFDCSGLNEEAVLMDVLGGSDLIYLVIDPMPTRLISSQAFAEKIRSDFPGCELVVNKYAKGIHKRELKSFLGTGDYHTEEALPIEKIYRAEYNCLLA